MKIRSFSLIMMVAGLLAAAPTFAQTSPAQKPQTQDGNNPTTIGPASGASTQQARDGNSPTTVGPASEASKQRTQSLSHGDPNADGGKKQN